MRLLGKRLGLSRRAVTCACLQCAAQACLVRIRRGRFPSGNSHRACCPGRSAHPPCGSPSGQRISPGGRTIGRPAARIVLTSAASPRIFRSICVIDSYCPRLPFVAQSGPRRFLDPYPEFRRVGGMTPPQTQGWPSWTTREYRQRCEGGEYDYAKGPGRFL